jgi:hypothetical protein
MIVIPSVRGVLAPSSFNPLTIPDLQVWLKADIGVVTSGSNVTAWNDQSGNNRNFEKSIPNTGFPTLVGSEVRFTATATYNSATASILALPSSSLNFTTPYTLISVSRAGGITGNQNAAVFSKSNDDVKRRKYQLSISGGILYSLEGNGDVGFQYDTGTGNNINVKRLVIIQYPSTTFGLMRYNGSQVETSNNSNTINQTNTAPVYIGASPFSSGIGYNAEASYDLRVSEILFYNRALTLTEIQQIENYLNLKYSVY